MAAGCEHSPTGPNVPPMAESYIRFQVTDGVGRPLADALVAVLDGPLAGTTKLTDAAGRAELSGRATGMVAVRVSREGFHTRTEGMWWESSTSASPFFVPFRLHTIEPAIGLEPGDYMLTIAIDTATGHKGIPQAPCAGFPVELASRTYRVAILQGSSSADSRYYVRADDRPLHYEDLFSFTIAGRFVGFEIDDGIPEDLPGFRFLDIGGNAPTTEPAIATASSVSIPFFGEFRYCELKVPRDLQRLLTVAGRADCGLPLVRIR